MVLSHSTVKWSGGLRPRQRARIRHLEQKSCPQLRQWCLRSAKEKRTPQARQLSPPSSRTQWSAMARPGCSVTLQVNTRPRASPTYTVLWSLRTRYPHRVVSVLQALAMPRRCGPVPLAPRTRLLLDGASKALPRYPDKASHRQDEALLGWQLFQSGDNSVVR